MGGLLPEATITKPGLSPKGMCQLITAATPVVKIAPKKNNYAFINLRAIVYDSGNCFIYDILFATQGGSSSGNSHRYLSFGTISAPALKQDSSGNLYIMGRTYNNTSIGVFSLGVGSTGNSAVDVSIISEEEHSKLQLTEISKAIM